MTNITPLPFNGDLIEYLNANGTALEVLWRNGEAYFPVRPVCEILGLAYQPQHRKLTRADSEATVTFMMTVGADGKQREMLCIVYPDFMAWLINLTISRVKEEAREALRITKAEIKMVIATYYHDRLFGEVTERDLLLQKLRLDAQMRKPLRGRIVQAMEWGWDFDGIWQSCSASRPRLVLIIKECMMLGLIKEAPEGTPFEKVTTPDARQLPLFSES